MKTGPRLYLLYLTAFVSLFSMGFDFSKHSIPLSDIRSGGPPKDGIPAILKPKFVKAEGAAFLMGDDRVLGITRNGVAKAYPIKILNWHEIVNDTVGRMPVLISYCPLCGTGMAFDPVVNGARLTFGVSGRLYKSDVLMYDHQTESLWSQIMQEAVTGPMTGARLTLLPLVHTTWKAWRKAHPDTLVLSTDTGFFRDYRRDPYAAYAETDRLMFPVGRIDPRYRPKSWVLGVTYRGETKAYPFSELDKGPRPLRDRLGGEEVTILYDPADRTARIVNAAGKDIPSVAAYWFAWSAFHPDTLVYRGG